MRKIQELARECGVTDRTILYHISANAKELEGHIERKGRNGTWLDEVGEEIIRSRMIKHPMIVQDSVNFADENAALKKQNNDLLQMVATLQQRLIELQDENKHVLLEAKDRQLALEAASSKSDALQDLLDAAKAATEQKQAELDVAQAALAGAQAEAQSYKKSIFGFYRKKG